MIHINLIRENSEDIIERLAIKGLDARSEIMGILNLDGERKAIKQRLDQNLAEANILARQIGDMLKQSKKEEAEVLRNRTIKLKERSKELEQKFSEAEQKLFDKLVLIPNVPSRSVPKGKTPQDNDIVLTNGAMPVLNANAQPHWELAKRYDLIDFELGVKISGAGFPVYKGKGARLQRALINFFLDEAIKAGYQEVQPPILINEDSGFGTGQLPDKEGQMYHVGIDSLFLIPTAEVPITNLYRDVILKEEDFPVKNVGYTPCFRREAGSYGQEVRGLNRLHQFDKVEIVQLASPENSYTVLEEMQTYVQGLLQKLGLPYRVLKLCGGDMSFASALTYDMEVYSGAQQKWLEVSSVSNFESFQSNRLKLRYKDKEGQMHLAHTLNGSALALPRIVAALLENNQFSGGIKMPEVLHPYLGFTEIV
jgi:seryl-tRNA synthetase